jgi:hypothetical protein
MNDKVPNKRETKGWRIVPVLLTVAALSLPPRPAAAQFFCEMPFIPAIAAGLLVVIQDVLIDAGLNPGSGLLPKILESETHEIQSLLAENDQPMVQLNIGSIIPGASIIPGLGSAITIASESFHFGGIGYMDVDMRHRLDDFWDAFQGSLKAMTAQIYASGINNARLIASLSDAGNMSSGGLEHQSAEIDEKIQHAVSDESCQFDTMAQSLGAAGAISTAVSAAYSQQYNDIGHNQVGSPAAAGPGGFNNMRFQLYLNKFCDVNSNAGSSPCFGMRSTKPATEMGLLSLITPAEAGTGSIPLPNANASSSPSSTVFGKGTIGMKTQDERDAVNELVTNLIGYQPPPIIPTKALQSAQGKEQEQINREYVTQMDAVGALAWDVIGDRAPGKAAPDIQQMRFKVGVNDASPTPSQHEVLQAVISQLDDPNYFVNVGGGGGTVAQKEVYLKAYNAMLLYKLIEKQEKISDAYAIQTANMLKNLKDVHLSVHKDSPMQ